MEEDKIAIISRQTNYSETEIREKLEQYGGDEVKVIKSYLGVPLTIDVSKCVRKSVNQEIYRQIRYNLDSGIRDFNAVQNANLEKEIK